GYALRLHSDTSNADALISAEHEDLGGLCDFDGGYIVHATCAGENDVAIDITTSGINYDGINIECEDDGSDGLKAIVLGDAAVAVQGTGDTATSFGVRGIGGNSGTGGHFIGGVVAGKAVVAEADADVAVAAEGGVTGTGAVVGLGKA